MRSRRVMLVVRVVGIAVVLVLLWVFADRIDWALLRSALRDADVSLLLVATLLYFVSLFAKSAVWHVLLAPTHDVPTRRLFRYTIAAYAAAVLTPARAGEVVRVLALKQREHVPAADSTGILLTDKLLHVITLLLIAAPLPLLLPSLPEWVEDSLLLGAGAALGALVALYIAVGRVTASEPQSWFARFLASMHGVREPRRLFASLGVLALVWCCDLASLLAVLYALDIEVPIAAGLFIMFTLNMAIAIPTTPANLGTFQLGALVATGLLRIPHEPALAFALLYQAVQVIPVLIVGAILEMRLIVGRPESGKLAA